MINSEKVDRLLVAPRFPDIGHVLPLVHVAKSIGVRVTLAPFLGGVVGPSAELGTVGGVSMLRLPQLDLSRSARIMKRGMDLIGATAGLVVAAPVIWLAAVLIKLDSSGPALFRQVRTGRDGTRFEILKFRTMVDGADSRKAQLTSRNETAGLFKIADDPRVTRVGRFLRKTSLTSFHSLARNPHGHEPGRPPASGRGRGRKGRRMVPSPTAATARHDRALAGTRLSTRPARRHESHRLLIRRKLVAVGRHQDTFADDSVRTRPERYVALIGGCELLVGSRARLPPRGTPTGKPR